MIKWAKRMYERFVTREIIVYLICGVIVTVTSLSIYRLCVWFNASVFVSNTLSSFFGITLAYFLNKIYVFHSRSWALKTVLQEMVSFGAGRLVTYVMETALLMLLIDVWGLPNFYCKLLTMVLVTISNYVISKFAVFKKH